MLKLRRVWLVTGLLLPLAGIGQESASTSKPTEHLIGTITAIDATGHTVTMKEDKSRSEQVILLENTKTLIKVPPGAKDLKNATRITADQLAAGDRIDVRGFKSADDPAKIAARSVVLMSARELQEVHRAQAAEWQHSTAGVVTSIEPSSGKIMVSTRIPEGPKPVTLQTSRETEFTRYSPDTPGRPVASELGQIQPGDRVMVIGERSADDSTITARKVYSGAFRMLNGTIVSIAEDGKQLTIKDLASKKPVNVTVDERSTVRKLPPELAMGLARRLNAGGRAASDTGARRAAGNNTGVSGASPDSPPATHGARNGDISQLIERLPKASLADLKAGDAVVVSAVAGATGNSEMIATSIIAGVEPILQSAPARQNGQVMGGDWGLGEMAVPQ